MCPDRANGTISSAGSCAGDLILPNRRYAALVVLGATCILWSARVVMQIANPQGSTSVILEYGLLLSFTLVLVCHAVALLLVILDKSLP